ncbi:hypothetical protein PMIN06_003314 [Paraphaeosphaeria minitans]
MPSGVLWSTLFVRLAYEFPSRRIYSHTLPVMICQNVSRKLLNKLDDMNIVWMFKESELLPSSWCDTACFSLCCMKEALKNLKTSRSIRDITGTLHNSTFNCHADVLSPT